MREAAVKVVRRPHTRRRALLGSVAAIVLVLLAGCEAPRPEGPEPLRYRDAVFTNVTVTRDITYGEAPDAQGNPAQLKLDLYEPAGDDVSARPAVVWVHGGGFSAGSKASGAGYATFMAGLGYVAVSIDYRLLAPPGCASTRPPSPECQAAAIGAQHDAQAAVRWLRSQASARRIDTDRIGIAGSSAGAITSLLVGGRSEDPGSSGNPGYSSRVQGSFSVSGGTPTNEWVSSDDPRMYFLHGTADEVVPYAWAQANTEALLRAGVPTFLNPIEGAGHGLPGPYQSVIREQSSYFFYLVMDLANAER